MHFQAAYGPELQIKNAKQGMTIICTTAGTSLKRDLRLETTENEIPFVLSKLITLCIGEKGNDELGNKPFFLDVVTHSK